MSTNRKPVLPHVSATRALGARVLGPLEVLVNGKAAVLRRPMQRTLLALLLVRAGEAVSVDRLMDELWAGGPPDTARASLQNCVSQLRKVLGADALLTHVGGYSINVQPEQIDVGQFHRRLAEARAAAATRSRARKLRAALALWRGPAFADIRPTPSLEFEASLLHELRISTLEEAIDADLQLGCTAELVPELERLIASEPYRERLRAQLILALYRSGRQMRALAEVKKARHTLVSELGLEPSPTLRNLERAILVHDPALASRGPSRHTTPQRPHSARSGRRRRSLTAV